MPCFSPLHAFKGKSKDPSKIAVVWRSRDSVCGERLDLPCGQCIGCRLERSRQWAVRCMHEASLYEENSFITLTYDDKHMPVNRSLVLSDFQKFMKRLRRDHALCSTEKVRFYHCGEYGDRLGRPHYHALLFNYGFTDKKFFSKRGENVVYTSEKLSNLWRNGFSVVGDVSFDSAAYVARYVMKKLTGDRKVEYGDRVPEYSTMSRRPGIGKGWFERFSSDVFPLDRVVVNGKETRPPRFYDGLFEKADPVAFEDIKLSRELNAEKFNRRKRFWDGERFIFPSESDGDRLLVKEVVKKAEVSQLVRPLEGVI